jgi:hypothetical protein
MNVLVAVFVFVAVWVLPSFTIGVREIVAVGLGVIVFVLSVPRSLLTLEGEWLGDGVWVRVKKPIGVSCSSDPIKGSFKPGTKPVNPRMRMDMKKTVTKATITCLEPI